MKKFEFNEKTDDMKKFEFNEKTDELFRAILSLKNIKEAKMFFRDLCTWEEIMEMALRWEIVRLLNKNMTYRDIAEKLKVSTTTVSRVAFWLENGRNGYKLLLNRLYSHHSFSSFKKS